MRKLVPWLFAMVVVAGCGDDELGDDTCNQGDNMVSPAVAGAPDALAPSPEVHIVWQPGTGRGADLPDDYFDRVAAAPESEAADAAHVTGVDHPSAREIVVRFDDLSSYAGGSTLDVVLKLPDRSEFIACSHPGSADRYLVELHLVFAADGSLSSEEIIQRTQLGDI